MKGWTEKHLQQLKERKKIVDYKVNNPGTHQPKAAKYHNQRVDVDGLTFDSKKEAARYKLLKVLLKKGEIAFLARQVEYTFQMNGGKIASYYADFQYMTKDAVLIVEDVKSEATRKLPAYRLKRKMMLLQHGIKIKEV